MKQGHAFVFTLKTAAKRIYGRWAKVGSKKPDGGQCGILGKRGKVRALGKTGGG